LAVAIIKKEMIKEAVAGVPRTPELQPGPPPPASSSAPLSVFRALFQPFHAIFSRLRRLAAVIMTTKHNMNRASPAATLPCKRAKALKNALTSSSQLLALKLGG
jgi:hypothetical protein